MSTAILISGQMRTFAKCYPSIRWQVLGHFPDPHFFITVQDTPDCQSIADLVRDYGADRVHADVRQDPDLAALDPLRFGLATGPAYDQAPYANAAPAAQLLMQHWYQNEVWKFFQSFECGNQETNPKGSGSGSLSFASTFETIIRLRTDLFFQSFHAEDCESVFSTDCFTPWWGEFGGINDRFAIMGPAAAAAYFTVYEQLPELIHSGCPFHPESLVAAALERANIRIHRTLRTEFTTLRVNGQHRPPEIAPWDIAHAALHAA